MTLSILLPIYGIIIVVLGVLAFLTIWHLFRFGEQTFMGFASIFIFIVGIVFILFFTQQLLQGTQWNQPLINIPGKTMPHQSL